MTTGLKKSILETIQKQNGVIFASPAFVGRGIYAGRGIIADNADFVLPKMDSRGYLPVEWWIMSKTVAKNAIPLENEGLTSLLINGQSFPLPQALEVAEKELMGDYCNVWPLTKVLDIGGPARVPCYSIQGGEAEPEIPPIPCHVHAGEVVNGMCVGHGKTEAYFFPPTDVPPYNLTLEQVKTRLGFKPKTTQEQVLQALKTFGRCDDMYSLLNVYEIHPWESWSIEEKIVHAPGPWPTFEIQRPQDDYNLLAWQLGQQVSNDELTPVKRDHQLKGLADEESLFSNTIDFPSNIDPNFKQRWWRKCEILSEGVWGRHLRLFYHIFYGEGFVIRPGQSFTRQPDPRPYAGIIWTGDGIINGLPLQVGDKDQKEFLVTPNASVEFTNTSSQYDMMVFTVFPMNI